MSEEASSEGTAQKLMETLIRKMEEMDAKLSRLEGTVNSPNALLRKAGYVSMKTPHTEDLLVDGFRGDLEAETQIMKSNTQNEFTNEEIHEMSWEEIHDMASQHQNTQEMY
jgi:hypothetical protein|tara:strand:- start:350 stop:682 length:333 start_codon:yes stop_codon:yes gene_type:complete